MGKNTTIFNTCHTCGFRGKFQNGTPGCTITNRQIPGDLEGYCDSYRSEDAVYKCKKCGIPLLNPLILEIEGDEDYALVCQNCYRTLGSCHSCMHSETCGVMTDSSEPPYVMMTKQQGPMMMQVQVKNPNLVEKHCTICKCAALLDYTFCCKDEEGVNCPNWQLSPQWLQ